MKEAIVLFAHGARDPEWARPVRRLAELVGAGEGGPRAEVAFMEFMGPTLELVVDGLATEGYEQILVVPVFLAQGGHLKRDVPELVMAAQRRHPDCRIRLTLAVGEDEGVLRAMADYAQRSLAAD